MSTSSTISKLRLRFGRKRAEDEGTTVNMNGLPADDKIPDVTASTGDTISPNNEPAIEDPEKDLVPTEDAQRGVQQVEAVTLTWTKPYLIAVFIK